MARSGLALPRMFSAVAALVAGSLLLGCGASRHAAATSGIPRSLLLQARPIGSGVEVPSAGQRSGDRRAADGGSDRGAVCTSSCSLPTGW